MYQGLKNYKSSWKLVNKMEEDIVLEGWKGKGDTQINECMDTYRIIEHRKNKETREIYDNEHIIPKVNVDVLWKIISEKADMEIEYKYKWIVRKILEHYKFHEKEGAPIEFFMEAFNGGKNRAKYYFPYVYYPLKVLEVQNKIRYFGRGGIMRVV